MPALDLDSDELSPLAPCPAPPTRPSSRWDDCAVSLASGFGGMDFAPSSPSPQLPRIDLSSPRRAHAAPREAHLPHYDLSGPSDPRARQPTGAPKANPMKSDSPQSPSTSTHCVDSRAGVRPEWAAARLPPPLGLPDSAIARLARDAAHSGASGAFGDASRASPVGSCRAHSGGSAAEETPRDPFAHPTRENHSPTHTTQDAPRRPRAARCAGEGAVGRRERGGRCEAALDGAEPALSLTLGHGRWQP